MNVIEYPLRTDWVKLCQRPALPIQNLENLVIEIIENVKSRGDEALIEYTKKFDNVLLNNLKVSNDEIEDGIKNTNEELKVAIQQAAQNIRKFHAPQYREETPVETIEGVVCWRKNIAIEKVGLYIPGGTAPLFSTLLMLAIPAQIAGCSEIILCTPCDKNGNVNAIVLYTANLLGVTDIYKIGGAQAIAAMAYGTETIPNVFKILGPGNQFVTKAKELVLNNGVAIDMPAGPTELLIIADDTAVPEFTAADLLAQAEHGSDSQVILLSTSATIIEMVKQEITIQLKAFSRKRIATEALSNSRFILLDTIESCLEFSNLYAPEHLILAIENAEKYCNQIKNAGSVFVGNYTPESAGDYASGTNHTLPTNGNARAYSGVSVDSFLKKITFQNISLKGLQLISKTIEIMAEAETLQGHKNAVSIRLKSKIDY